MQIKSVKYHGLLLPAFCLMLSLSKDDPKHVHQA